MEVKCLEKVRNVSRLKDYKELEKLMVCRWLNMYEGFTQS